MHHSAPLEMAFPVILFTVFRPPLCSDQNLDTKLELLRSREYLEHTFKNLAEYREGTYKGQWKNGKPYGRWAEPENSSGGR